MHLKAALVLSTYQPSYIHILRLGMLQQMNPRTRMLYPIQFFLMSLIRLYQASYALSSDLEIE